MHRLFFLTSIFTLYLNVSIAQENWGLYVSVSNTSILNKTAAYNKVAFNSTDNFEARQPFYGTFLKKASSYHKNFGAWYKLPFEKEKANYYLVAGVSTYGHKETSNGGKSEDYPYGFSQNLPPGDSAIKLENRFRNYFFTLGVKGEYKLKRKFFTEIQLSYCVNKNNQDKTVKAFRSVFDPYVYYKDGNERGKDYAFTDVNYNGILFLQSGFNYNIGNQIKLHLLYSISVTPVNKRTDIKKLYYQGIAFQISYSAF